MAASAGTQRRMQKIKEGWKELGVTCRNSILSGVVRIEWCAEAPALGKLCSKNNAHVRGGGGDLGPGLLADGGKDRRRGNAWIVGTRDAGGKTILGREQGFEGGKSAWEQFLIFSRMSLGGKI